MKYLLISPPKKCVKMFVESPPVGLGYLATRLRQLGHTVDIKDCIIENWDNKKTLQYIKDFKPDIVGFNVFSTALASLKELLVELHKQPDKPMVILGGPHVNGTPEHTLQFFPEADFAFRGESELPLTDFNEYLNGKRPLSTVRGLVYRTDKKIVSNEPVEHPAIEEFGFPAWDLIQPSKYFSKVNVGDKSINIHFSRGCPFNCGFCVKLGTKVRFRSWEHIWEEMTVLNRDYGVERFVINDEGFTMFPEKVKEFCRQVICKGVPYRFFTATGLRLNRVDDEMLQLMVKANFERVFGTGIESAVPRVREKLMNKRLTQWEITNGLRCLNRNGFQPHGNFILGYPGETRSELIESVNWACDAYERGLIHGASMVPFLPLPGSPVVKQMMESGELPKDWDFSKLNLQVICYAPKGMTIKELDSLRRWAVLKFNLRWKILKRYLNPLFFPRAVVSFLRIYLPNWMLRGSWRRL